MNARTHQHTNTQMHIHTGDVTVSVNLFQKKDLGDSFPIVAKGFRAVSHLLELLPEGLTFATEVACMLLLHNTAH